MRSIFPKAGWMLAGVLALYVLSALAGVVTGGPLDPPGAPAPTMKTLGDIAPSWHQLLPSDNGDTEGCDSTRFTCVMGGVAVLDNETGLVWERTPDTATNHQWHNALSYCQGLLKGGRYGWRLPSLEELSTLRDGSPDGMPDGAPLPSPGETIFWTSSTEPNNPAWTLYVPFNSVGGIGATLKDDPFGTPAWCVRGGSGMDAYAIPAPPP
jgi:hypothetical protein